ncbi:Translation initiation factor IF-2 [Rhynchospora pubera]|uniref:Translation initiation factor IF-2 n=1 Tax=Rhynchospora pubera TaxID=906938 RepID=A0AAV8F4F3_9POAL|nr:Translation initiation factor IF-2 [Rhynchospora pubera]
MSQNRGSRQSPMRERKPSFTARILQGKKIKDESLDLFSWLRKSPNPAPPEVGKNNVLSQHGRVQGKTKRIANAKLETDDLLSPDVGKNEFNWLLTPPVSPLHPIYQQSSSTVQKEREITPKVKARSVSASRPSRLSQEASNSTMITKMARSSSVTRSSVLTNSTSNNVRRSSLPNTMSRSSSSGTLSNNHSSLKTTKPSPVSSLAVSNSKLPSSVTRPGAPRPPSPAKTRNGRTTQTPVPERPKSSPNATSHTPRTTTNPRAPTPPRRTASSTAQPPLTIPRSSSLSRLPSHEIRSTKTAKPPEKSISTVKQRLVGTRPSVSMNQRPATSPVTTPRKNMARSQFGENLGKSRLGSMSQGKKTGLPAGTTTQKALFKQVPAIDQSTISRTRSRKSLDASPKQSGTRQSGGDHPRATTYPRSNSSRLPAPRNRTEITSRSSGKIVPTDEATSSDRALSEEGSVRPLSDIFESSRYDFLMKEDARNMSWLRGDDEMSLRCPSFHRFDLPPEPFGE